MAQDFGTGVSRVLDPNSASLVQVILQAGKPPLDSEFNLLQQIATDWRQIMTLRGAPSGFLGNAVNMSESYITNPAWSNWFRFGQQRSGEQAAIEWAVVNGWVIPVTGTQTGTPPGSPDDASTWNRVTLDPPPTNSGDSRIDFIFLEAWTARVPPNPSTDNKPSASGIYRYGNVEGGYTFLADQIQDPELGFETSQRVQLQYRIRVVTGLIGLTTYPDGFDPTVVKARGAASADTTFTFENMREELGDPGLWRAGDGTPNSLGTTDGYSYAVPIACVFRRNSVTWDGDPGQNLNGGFNRNPTAVDRTGWTTFSSIPALAADITAAALSLSLDTATNIDLPLTPASPVLIQVGDELMTYSSITGTTMTLVTRGALGTKAEAHLTGDQVRPVSSRPDGLFSDQVVKTDILDLRHAVNPNGFDYDALLRGSLDKLLRGELRSNWKRSGAGPQGPFVLFQDKISASAAALGVTKLDAPDGIRQVFSDSAMAQRVELVITTPAGQGTAVDVSTSWSLGLSATADNNSGTSGELNPGDTITVPISQFKVGLPGGDADQVRFLGSESGVGSVTMQIDGETYELTEGGTADFTIASITDSSDDLVITLGTAFPTLAAPRRVKITFHVMYGPGRGLSRRPDSVHSVSYLSVGSDILKQLRGVPANNTPTRSSWALLWSKYRSGTFHNLLPVTAESYVDPGSKTVILQPFRRIELPSQIRTIDGTNINPNTEEIVSSGSDGAITAGSAVFTSPGANFTGDGVGVGDILISTNGVFEPVRVAGSITATTFEVDALSPTAAGTLDFRVTFLAGLEYTVVRSQGLMPLDALDGTSKWSLTDPLNLFSGQGDSTVARKNIATPLQRSLVPGWGAVRVPIIHSDPTTTPSGGSSTFDQGINFGVLTKKGGAPFDDSEQNYIPFNNGGLSYAAFSTFDFVGGVQATFNTSFTFSGNSFAGARFFNDTRGLGRQGLELPPFYGVARLWAVYERLDYQTNGSAFDPSTREPTGGGATNLLRQDFNGDTMWIEIDSDGDSTFILNAEALDLAKSPNAIASFASGHYVVEASIFGFDRGTFDLSQEPRLILTRERDPSQANSGTRTNNFGAGASALIFSPDLVLPGPHLASDEIAVNFSRTPYQGDAWGSTANHTDIGYKPGPLTTGTLFQLTNTELDEANLTRPNQKTLEVLAAVGFVTTLGSGRLSGDFGSDTFDFRNVGYEDASVLPPTLGSDPRPIFFIGGVESNEQATTLGTEYHNCVERLPLGAEFREKDFRGGFYAGPDSTFTVHAPLVYTNYAPGVRAVGVAASSGLEQIEVPINTSSVSSGQPGEILAHVDGEQGNYGLLTNYRTNRGGSVFTASGNRPGGEVNANFQQASTATASQGVLSGVAMLVRNTVTAIGANEVSAGGELMMLICTSAQRLSGSATELEVLIGTNGSGEGSSSADLFRVQGRPLLKDNVRVEIDPATISLPKKAT